MLRSPAILVRTRKLPCQRCEPATNNVEFLLLYVMGGYGIRRSVSLPRTTRQHAPVGLSLLYYIRCDVDDVAAACCYHSGFFIIAGRKKCGTECDFGCVTFYACLPE